VKFLATVPGRIPRAVIDAGIPEDEIIFDHIDAIPVFGTLNRVHLTRRCYRYPCRLTENPDIH